MNNPTGGHPPFPRPEDIISLIDITEEVIIPDEPQGKDQIEIIDLIDDSESAEAPLEPLIPDESQENSIQRLFKNLFKFAEDTFDNQNVV